jgi:uncharacterized protein (TIGR02246 family)
MPVRFTLLIVAICALAAALSVQAQTLQGNASDVAAIHQIIDGHAIYWNKGDAKMVAQLWHEDGDIRDPNGIVKGRAAIEARYEKMFAGWAKGTVHSHPGSVNIRFLRPDVVVADGFYEVEGIKDANGKPQPAEKGTWTIVCTKVNGEWGIASLR